MTICGKFESNKETADLSPNGLIQQSQFIKAPSPHCVQKGGSGKLG